MADRRCPYCGELVPSTSITCPRCYKKIPVQEPEPVNEKKPRGERKVRDKDELIALFLAVVPALVGFIGIGLVYKYRQSRIGYMFLMGGLILFGLASLIVVAGLGNPIALVVSIPLYILYVLAFLLSLFLTSAGTVMKFTIR